MKKRELIHFHALLGTLAGQFIDEGIVTHQELEQYDSLEVSPMTMTGSRDDHEEAVLLLSKILTAAVEEEAENAESRDKQTQTA
jgi:Predicted metal-binding protein